MYREHKENSFVLLQQLRLLYTLRADNTALRNIFIFHIYIMDFADIITLARTQTNTSIGQISDATMLIYGNIAYHLIENRIIKEISDDYFYTYFTTNLTSWTNEYTIPASSSTVKWVKRILSVEVKYSATDPTRTLAVNRQNDNYWVAIDYLATYQDKSNPIYDIKDSSIFLYPTPTETVSWWLVMQAIVNLIDLTLSDTEDKIFPNATELRAWHYMIAEWMKQFIYDNKQQEQEKINAINNFEINLRNMIKSIQRNKKQTLTVSELPDFTYYKY